MGSQMGTQLSNPGVILKLKQRYLTIESFILKTVWSIILLIFSAFNVCKSHFYEYAFKLKQKEKILELFSFITLIESTINRLASAH